MEPGKRAFGGLGRGSLRRLVRLACAAMGCAVMGGGAHAGSESACQAINSGVLNVELGAEGSVTRQVALKAGDKLTFNFEADAGPFGSLTLLSGAGAPRSLLVGPTGTRVSFVATKGGAFDFEFGKEGTDAAAFTATCVPAGAARSAASSAGSRRRAKLFGEAWKDAEIAEGDELAGVVLDTGGPDPVRVSAAKPWLAPPSLAHPSALAQAGGLDTKLQWRGERYRAGGPDGFQIDTSTSGVDAAVKYKVLPEIMVGALAQIDQPGETVIGAPPALSDRGWMVGPVTNVTLAPGLKLDARAAWGLSESSPDELSPHAASVARRMVSARLANTQSFGPWRVSPSISVNHTYDAAAASTPIPTAHDDAVPYTAGFGRIDVGPEFAYRIDLDKSGYIEPRAAVGTFWGFDTLSNLGPGTAGHNDMRLKAGAGVTVGASDGSKLQAGGTVEEGEAGAANVWSGRLQLSVPMQ